jgi:hypothetical protein
MDGIKDTCKAVKQFGDRIQQQKTNDHNEHKFEYREPGG